MLTEEPAGVIESDIAEDLKTAQNGRNISSLQLQEALGESFKGKIRPDEKEAVVVIGALGVGKTRFARAHVNDLPPEKKSGTIYIGHYEGGAAENLPAFKEPFYAATMPAERLAVTKQFNPALGVIVKHTIRQAAARNFSVVLDIDGTEEEAQFDRDNLLALGYDKVSFAAIHARFDVVADRSDYKFWATDDLDIVQQRIEALSSMPVKAALGSNFDFYSNNYAEMEAQKIFTMLPGAAPVIFDADALKKICADLSEDIAPIKAHLKFLRKKPEYKGRIDLDKMMDDYTAASQKTLGFLNEVQANGKVQPKESGFKRFQDASRKAAMGSRHPS